jgi:hypothetical protein
MANGGSNTRTPRERIARLGAALMTLVAGKDLRVREAIARAAERAHAGRDLDLKKRWHAGHDLAANPRVE